MAKLMKKYRQEGYYAKIIHNKLQIVKQQPMGKDNNENKRGRAVSEDTPTKLTQKKQIKPNSSNPTKMKEIGTLDSILGDL